jgi:hypothetical protein
MTLMSEGMNPSGEKRLLPRAESDGDGTKAAGPSQRNDVLRPVQ